MRYRSILFMGTALLWGCSTTEPSGNLPLEATPEGKTAFQLHALGQTRLIIPVASVDLDRVSAALEPASGRVLAAILHGTEGGASLQLIRNGETRSLLETARDESLSAPVWSPGGESFAFALIRPTRLDASTRKLVHRGDLWYGSADGALRRVAPSIDDVARVLGWVGDTLLITRQTSEDVPEERLATFDLRRGELRDLLVPSAWVHLYNATLVGERVGLVRTRQPAASAPSDGQELEVLLVDLAGRVQRVSTERGAMPIELSLDGDKLGYRLEGSSQQVTVDLRTKTRAVRFAERSFALPSYYSSSSLLALYMPYVHQVYDTPDDFNGSWACGPTTMVMAIQHFGRLKPWPVTISVPTSHQNDFGAYVAYKYSAYGTTFDRMQTDASGKAAYGAYGWCTDGGGAWAWRMQDYAKKHELSSDFYGSTSFNDVKNAIDDGKVVALSTQLTSAGHIIAVKGYTADGKLIVNDPYGNKTLGSYPNWKGADTEYGFSYVIPKWHITIYGTPTKMEPAFAAALADKSVPTSLNSGGKAKATLTFKNTGTQTWNDSTRLGTTVPRDRDSAFHSSDWLNKHRAASAGTVKPGATGSFSFTLTAPDVTAKKTYKECFNLVQEGTTWFSDEGQGGPKDDALCLNITVLPPSQSSGETIDAEDVTAAQALFGPGGPAAGSAGRPSGGRPGDGCAIGGRPGAPSLPSSLPLLIVLATLGGRLRRRGW